MAPGRNRLAIQSSDDIDADASSFGHAPLMTSLDSVSLAILLGAVLVMAGILSSLLALRFGAPLLLVFLLIGVLAGDSGPGGLNFNHQKSNSLILISGYPLLFFRKIIDFFLARNRGTLIT